MTQKLWKPPQGLLPNRVVIGMTNALWGNMAPYVADPDESAINRQRLSEELGLATAQLYFADQVHGHSICLVDSMPTGSVGSFDGLMTRQPGQLVMVFAADCVPIWLTNCTGTVVAVLHAGWRGSASGMAKAGIEVMISLGILPGALQAVIGPCIQSDCYEVNLDTARHFPGAVTRRQGSKWYVDLPEYNRLMLQEGGLSDGNIHLVNDCVHCDPSYFSYRRQGVNAGRMAAYAYLKAI